MAIAGQCEPQDVNHGEAHPGARCGHTLTHLHGANVTSACSGKLVLFGGTALKKASPQPGGSANGSSILQQGGGGVREERTADVFALSLFDGQWRRVAIQASGPPPPVGRIGHAAVAISGALLIHGGLAADGTVLDDIHLLRMSRLGTSGHWERIGTVQTGGRPCARYGHSMALLADRYLVLFGGNSGRAAVGDTWVLDVGPGGSGLGLGAADVTAPLPGGDGGEEAAREAARRRAAQAASGTRETMCMWRQLVSGGCPTPRSFAATAASADTLYVCGGVSADQTALSDAFRLGCDRGADGVTWRWRRLPDVPVARVHAAAAVVAGSVHVVGGWVGERRLPEPEAAVLVLHEEDGMWDEARLDGGAAGALCAARLAVAGCRDVLYAHGGLSDARANGGAGAQAPVLQDTCAYSSDSSTIHARTLQLRGPSTAFSAETAAPAPSDAASPGPSTSASTVPSQPQHAADDSRTGVSAGEPAAVQSVPAGRAEAAGAAVPDDGLVPTSAPASVTTFVSPYHEIPVNAPQDTAILETGLLSGSEAPHADALSRAGPAQSPPQRTPPRPAAARPPFPPPATAASASPEHTRVYEPPPRIGGEGMKRSGSISRSVMWMPLPSFTDGDADEDSEEDVPPVPAIDPHALNPYSATVSYDHTGVGPGASPATAQHASRPPRAFGWQHVGGLDAGGSTAHAARAQRGSNSAQSSAGTAGTAGTPGGAHAANGAQLAPQRGAAALPGPAPAGSYSAVKRVVRQLDGLKTSRLFGKYAIVKERHIGGRSVIQFATKGMQRVAIKFYAPDAAGRAAFDSDREALADPALAPLLPPLLHVYDNAGGEHVDGRKQPLPPAVVFARGTPLSELVTQFWNRHSAGDVADTSELHAPLACAARCLADLHAAGVVHRDIRPGHILWFPGTADRRDRCAFVDLAAAVGAGREVLLSYTLAYAAPELVEADARGWKRVTATPQHDEWALGVLMYEALTSHSAFDLWALGEERVAQLLRGKHRQPLPWQDPAAAERLGVFRKPLCGLLVRNPTQRLSISQFYDACNQELSASTRVSRRGTGFAAADASDAMTGGGSSGGDSPDASGSTAMSKRERIKAAGKGISNFMKGFTRTSAHD